MRLHDLAVRLAAVESKLATLTGTVANTDIIDDVAEFDQRLSVVEVQVDQLIALKTHDEVAVLVVEDVVHAQHEAAAIENPEVAVVVAAAVAAVVAADPEVVKDPEAVTALIKEAVAEAPVPSAEAVQAAADAVAVVVAAATGTEVAPELKEELVVAVAAPADPVLDALETRLAVAEAKVDSLLGK